MDILPPEIILNIFSFLPQHELLTHILHVCKSWRELGLAPSLWLNVNTHPEDEEKNSTYLKNIETFCYHVKHLRTSEDFIEKINLQSSKRQFRSLQELDLSNAFLVSAKVLVEFIPNCSLLNSLSIRFDNSILFQDLFHILYEYRVEDLQLNYSGDDIEFLFVLELLSRQTFLKTLSVHCNTIQNNTVEFLFENFTNLKSCDVTSSYLKNETFMKMKPMPWLTSLSIDYTRVNDDGVKQLSLNIPNLKLFSVVRCENITDEGFINIAEHCPLIEQVNICRSHAISGITLRALAHGCPRLRRLSIMACAQIDNDGVITLVKKCLRLRLLILNFCIQLSDNALFGIAENCVLLKKLDISHNGKFTSAGICKVLQSCIWLESLNFASCSGIEKLQLSSSVLWKLNNADSNVMKSISDNEHFEETIRSIPLGSIHSHVRSINMSHTSVSNSSVLELLLFCPDLRNLYMFGCINVTLEIIDALFKYCLFMEKISVKRKTVFRHNYIRDNISHKTSQ